MASQESSAQQSGDIFSLFNFDNNPSNNNNKNSNVNTESQKSQIEGANVNDTMNANDDSTASNNDAPPKVDVSLKLKGVSEFSEYPFNKSSDKFLFMAGIKAPFFKANKRAAIDMCCVVDESSSMSGDRIKLVKETLEFIITQLEGKDRFGIVGYHDTSHVVVPLTYMDENGKLAATNGVKRLSPRGCTALCDGLIDGIKMMCQRDTEKSNPVSSVLLFTDGQANVGYQNATDICREMKKEAKKWAPVSSVRRINPNASNNHNLNIDDLFSFGKDDKKQQDQNQLQGQQQQQAPQAQQAQQTQQVQQTNDTESKSNDDKDKKPKIDNLMNQALAGFGSSSTKARSSVTMFSGDGNNIDLGTTSSIGSLGSMASSNNNSNKNSNDNQSIFSKKTQKKSNGLTMGQMQQQQLQSSIPDIFSINNNTNNNANRNSININNNNNNSNNNSNNNNNNVNDSKEKEAEIDLSGFLTETVEEDEFPCVVNTFGFGAGHNASLLQSIAETGNGMYAFIQNKDMIAESFAECLGGLISIIGKNLELRVMPFNNVIINKCLSKGYTTETSLNKDNITSYTIKIHDIQSEEEKDILFELTLPKLDSNKPRLDWPYIQLTLKYNNIIKNKGNNGNNSNKHGEIEMLSKVCQLKRTAMSEDREKEILVRNEELDLQYGRITAAEAMETANEFAFAGNYVAAQATLNTWSDNFSSTQAANFGFGQDLLADVALCNSNCANANVFSSFGSKMLSMNAQAHQQQRSVQPGAWGSQGAYSNNFKSSLSGAVSKKIGGSGISGSIVDTSGGFMGQYGQAKKQKQRVKQRPQPQQQQQQQQHVLYPDFQSGIKGGVADTLGLGGFGQMGQMGQYGQQQQQQQQHQGYPWQMQGISQMGMQGVQGVQQTQQQQQGQMYTSSFDPFGSLMQPQQQQQRAQGQPQQPQMQRQQGKQGFGDPFGGLQ